MANLVLQKYNFPCFVLFKYGFTVADKSGFQVIYLGETGVYYISSKILKLLFLNSKISIGANFN